MLVMLKVLLGKALDLEAEAPGVCVYKRQSVFYLFKDFHSRENRHILPRPHRILSPTMSFLTLGKSCSFSGTPFLSCKSRMIRIYCVGNCKDKVGVQCLVNIKNSENSIIILFKK